MAWLIRRKDCAYFPLPGADTPGHTVIQIARQFWDSELSLRRRRPAHHTVVMVIEGQGGFRGDGGRVEVQPGTVFWYSPETCYDLEGDPASPFEVWLVNTGGVMAARNFVGAFGSLAGGCQVSNAGGLDQVFAAMLRDARTGSAFARGVADHYLAILLLLIHRNLATQHTHPSHGQTTYLEVKSLMDQQYMKLFTVAEFAQECGISYEHMSRLFHRYEGIPPSVYLQRLRMTQAAQHLAETGDAVAVIARRAGYADPFAFSKAFKRCLGQSPKDYRRRFRT